MFSVGEHRVKVVTGQKTQTINAGLMGRTISGSCGCEHPTFVGESDLTGAALGSVEALVEFLQEHYSGEIERSPATATRPAPVPRQARSSVPVGEDDAWTKRAVVLVEHAIDQFVIEFAELPYLHRVEHSLHCELYALLTANRTLGCPYPLAHGGRRSQLVHKEWPEPVPRPEKGNCRGNVDIAVLHPQALFEAGIDQFREGRIRPVIAVEIGLNYSLTHLSDDVAKLTNSGVEHSYVIHLVRDALVVGQFDSQQFAKLGDRPRVSLDPCGHRRRGRLAGLLA